MEPLGGMEPLLKTSTIWRLCWSFSLSIVHVCSSPSASACNCCRFCFSSLSLRLRTRLSFRRESVFKRVYFQVPLLPLKCHCLWTWEGRWPPVSNYMTLNFTLTPVCASWALRCSPWLVTYHRPEEQSGEMNLCLVSWQIMSIDYHWWKRPSLHWPAKSSSGFFVYL